MAATAVRRPAKWGACGSLLGLLVLLVAVATTMVAVVPQGADALSVVSFVATAEDGADSAAVHDDAEDDEGDDDDDDTPLVYKPPQPIKDKNQPLSVFDYFPGLKNLKPEDMLVEIALLVLLIVYGVNYYFGSQKNASLARAWATAHGDVFEQNFSYVGDGEGHLAVRDGASEYFFYGSGRKHIKYLKARLCTRARHDLAGLAYEIVYPSDDVLFVEVALNDKAVAPAVLAIVPLNKANQAKKDLDDLGTFTKAVGHAGIPDKYVVLTESGEVATTFLPQALTARVAELIKSSTLISLHLTDQYKIKPASLKESKEPPKPSITMQFKLKQGGLDTAPLKFLLDFIDHAAEAAKLSSTAIAKADKARQQAQADLAKTMQSEVNELAQAKKDEKYKADKEKYDKMSPDDQAKYDEVIRKRELKKRAGRLKVLR